MKNAVHVFGTYTTQTHTSGPTHTAFCKLLLASIVTITTVAFYVDVSLPRPMVRSFAAVAERYAVPVLHAS